jgi:hypothetical protein
MRVLMASPEYAGALDVAGLNHYHLQYEPDDSDNPLVRLLPPMKRLDHYTLRCIACGHVVDATDPNERHVARRAKGGHVLLRNECPDM